MTRTASISTSLSSLLLERAAGPLHPLGLSSPQSRVQVDTPRHGAASVGLLPSTAFTEAEVLSAALLSVLWHRLMGTPEAGGLGIVAQAAGGDGKLAAFTLQLIDSTFKQVWPSAMFEAGEGQPFVRIKGATRSLLSSAGPVTFIVFPGVVSEMIEVGPFGELPIWEDSTFAKLWKARLAECGKAV